MKKFESFKQLYDAIENPFKNQNLLSKVIDNKIHGNGDTYFVLINDGEVLDKGGINSNDYLEFANRNFEIWKGHILLCNEKEDFFKDREGLVNFLENFKGFLSIPQISQVREHMQNFLKNGAYWQHEARGFVYYKSSQTTVLTGKSSSETCRLYLNISNDKLYKFVHMFTTECDAQNVPYSFKFKEYGTSRSDAIIFYPDNESILQTINIISKIQNNHKELFDIRLSAPIASAKISQNLGFADEPVVACYTKFENGEQVKKPVLYSFNQKMESIIDNSLASVVLDKTLIRMSNDENFEKFTKDIIRRYILMMFPKSKIMLDDNLKHFSSYEKENIHKKMIELMFQKCEQNSKEIIASGLEYLKTKPVAPCPEIETNRKQPFAFSMDLGYDVQFSLSPRDYRNIANQILKTIPIAKERLVDAVFEDMKINAQRYQIDAEKFVIFEKPNGIKQAAEFEQYYLGTNF